MAKDTKELPEEYTLTDLLKVYPIGTKEIVLTEKQHKRYYDLIAPDDDAFPIFVGIPIELYNKDSTYYYRGVPVTT